MREKEGERDRVLVVFVQVFPIPVKRMSAVSGVGACFGYPVIGLHRFHSISQQDCKAASGLSFRGHREILLQDYVFMCSKALDLPN